MTIFRCDYARPVLEAVVRSSILLLICFLALLALPNEALAQAMPTLGELEAASGNTETDTSRLIFKFLFGKFGENPFTSVNAADTLLGSLFFIFNSVLFVVGVAYIGYNVVTAIAVSAHEGEVLGKRMNGLWIPIRLGTGVFGMVPVFSGFSLAQAVMLTVAFLGIGMANMLVTTAVDNADGFKAIIPPPGLATVADNADGSVDKSTADALLAMNVCALASQDHKRYFQDVLNLGRNPETRPTEEGIEVDGWLVDCGKILLNDQTDRMRSNDEWYRSVGFGGYRNSAVQYDQVSELAKKLVAAKRASLNSLNLEMRDLARTWYEQAKNDEVGYPSYPTADIQQRLNTILDAERQRISNDEATRTVGSSAFTEQAKEGMTKDGWMGIGSWYAAFAENDAAIQSAAVASWLEIVPPDLSSSNIPETLKEPILALIAAQEKAPDPKTCMWGIHKANALGTCSMGQSLAMTIFESAAVDTGGVNMVNPIMTAKNIGDWFLTAVGATYIGSVAAKFLPGKSIISKGAEGVSKMLSAINVKEGAAIGSSILIGFLVLGIVFAVYIPMIPFITWFTALVSYFASVIEGLIAAQVWAFSHLHSDGEGMGHKTERGYIYILNMLLRPGLMVVGFFFAAGLLTMMGTFLFQQLGAVIANVQGDTNTGPFIIVGLMFVVMILLVTLIQVTFNLIYEIPDRVIAWFGGGGMDAKMAKEMDGRTESKAENAARWTGQSGMLALSAGGKS